MREVSRGRWPRGRKRCKADLGSDADDALELVHLVHVPTRARYHIIFVSLSVRVV